MADAKETKTRTFVKKGANGQQLTREVTGPASEVAARFDGFVESPKSSNKATGGGSAPSAASS